MWQVRVLVVCGIVILFTWLGISLETYFMDQRLEYNSGGDGGAP